MVTPAGGSAVTLSTNSYDGYSGIATDAPLLAQHDSNMGSGFTMRGNVTQTTTYT
jgi:hypothetical protein